MGETIENGTVLRDGRYVVVGVIGSGSQGATLDAVDKKDGRAVAIKRFDVRRARSWKDVELAEREARVLSQLRHRGLPEYLEHFEQDGSLYLVMERIDGASLASLRAAHRSLTTGDVERMVREVGSILEYLHGLAPPVIHRDIKPGNVIRRPDGSFAIVDFGAVRDKLRPEGGSTVVGTFGYMAPEQFQGRATPKTDVYALGATALAMLTGRDPDGLPHKGLAIDVDEALRDTSTSRRLRDALVRMLAPDPDARATSVADAFRRMEEREPARGSSERGDERERAAPNRHERRREEKRKRREQRRWERGHRPRPRVGPPFLAFVVIGLFVARIAVALTTKIGVPLLLHVLARIFGRRLDAVADRVREQGEDAISRIDAVQERLVGTGHETPPIRTRVAGNDEVIDAEIVHDEDREDDEYDASRKQRGRRGSQ